MDHSDKRDLDSVVSSSFAQDSISEAGPATDNPCPSNQHNDATSAMLGIAFQVSFRFGCFELSFTCVVSKRCRFRMPDLMTDMASHNALVHSIRLWRGIFVKFCAGTCAARSVLAAVKFLLKRFGMDIGNRKLVSYGLRLVICPAFNTVSFNFLCTRFRFIWSALKRL